MSAVNMGKGQLTDAIVTNRYIGVATPRRSVRSASSPAWSAEQLTPSG
jgi:hypothetical protein